MTCREDRTRDHAFVELGWRVDAGNRTGGQRERGRLDRIELRLDMDDRIVLVAAVEETADPDLIRQFSPAAAWSPALCPTHRGALRPLGAPTRRVLSAQAGDRG